MKSRTHVVALLGRADAPTDGVEEYCRWLGRALGREDCLLELERVAWHERGWRKSLALLAGGKQVLARPVGSRSIYGAGMVKARFSVSLPLGSARAAALRRALRRRVS